VTDWPRQPDSRTCGPSVVVVHEGLPGPWPDFREHVLTTHRELNRVWPRALGTTPWAIGRRLGGRVRRYRREQVLAALPRPVPVYLGSRWLPRHVVLALGERDGEPLVYDPAKGAVVAMSTSRWQHPWWAVLPPGD
jgi:hypothetical protein